VHGGFSCFVSSTVRDFCRLCGEGYHWGFAAKNQSLPFLDFR